VNDATPKAVPDSVELLAPAKINPWLEILHRRDDGFHELEGLFLCVDWCDRLRARLSKGGDTGGGDAGEIRLRGSGPAWSPDIPLGRDNLVWRAVDATRRALGRPECGLEVELEKHVPSGAGLGGGSSDAAAAVRATEILLGAQLADGVAEDLLAALGSDCVFFRNAITTGFATCKGRGEQVRAEVLHDTAWTVAVLVPDLSIATRDVYAALAFPLSPPAPTPSLAPEDFGASEIALRAKFFNRLESIALQQFPRLRAWRDLLDRNGAEHFRMSGSGSAFFGFFRDADLAESRLGELTRAARDEGLELRGFRCASPAGRGTSLVT